MVDIINAAWFFKASTGITVIDSSGLSQATRNAKERLNNLTLKAIEFSDISERGVRYVALGDGDFTK